MSFKSLFVPDFNPVHSFQLQDENLPRLTTSLHLRHAAIYPHLRCLPLLCRTPFSLKALPPIWRTFTHFQILNHKIILPLIRLPSLTHIPSHRHIQQHPKIRHPPRPLRNLCPHDRSPINIPHQPSSPPRNPFFLLPREPKSMPTRTQIRQGCLKNPMLVPILPIEVSPMKTRMIHLLPIPRLENINLPVIRPRKRISG